MALGRIVNVRRTRGWGGQLHSEGLCLLHRVPPELWMDESAGLAVNSNALWKIRAWDSTYHHMTC